MVIRIEFTCMIFGFSGYRLLGYGFVKYFFVFLYKENKSLKITLLVFGK